MEEPRRPVFLVGFMGAGKSTIGRALARLLDWDFIDLDELIVRTERRNIPQIFAEEGEAYFRRLELQLLERLHGRTYLVVACGGGTYARDEGRALIDGIGRAVWLQVPLEEALERCEESPARPLLRGAEHAEALYRERLPYYRSAPIRIDCGGLTPEVVAERLASLL